MRSIGRGRSMLIQRRPPALSVSTLGTSGCSGGRATAPRPPRRRRGRFGMGTSRLVGQHRVHLLDDHTVDFAHHCGLWCRVPMARKPPVLFLALLALLLVLPATADAAIFHLSGVPAETVEGDSFSVTITREGVTRGGVRIEATTAAGNQVRELCKSFNDRVTECGLPAITFTGTQETVVVRLIDDAVMEPAEPLAVRLIATSAGDQVDGDATATLHDNDAEFVTTELTVPERAGVARLPLRR